MTYEKVICWVCEKEIEGIVLNTDDTTPSQIDPVHTGCYGKWEDYNFKEVLLVKTEDELYKSIFIDVKLKIP